MYVLIFALALCINFLYAMYVKCISEDKMLKAAIYGECFVIVNAIIVINYVNNHWYLVALVLGGFLGTMLTKQICSMLNIKI